MLEVEEGEDEGPQVIEIASDSEDGSEEEKEGQCYKFYINFCFFLI